MAGCIKDGHNGTSTLQYFTAGFFKTSFLYTLIRAYTTEPNLSWNHTDLTVDYIQVNCNWLSLGSSPLGSHYGEA